MAFSTVRRHQYPACTPPQWPSGQNCSLGLKAQKLSTAKGATVRFKSGHWPLPPFRRTLLYVQRVRSAEHAWCLLAINRAMTSALMNVRAVFRLRIFGCRLGGQTARRFTPWRRLPRRRRIRLPWYLKGDHPDRWCGCDMWTCALLFSVTIP